MPVLAGRIAHHRMPKTAPKKGWLAVLGPGLIIGVSEDDPSGIATYSQAGAQFGFPQPDRNRLPDNRETRPYTNRP